MTSAALNSHDAFDLRGQEEARAEADKKRALRERVHVEDVKWLMSNKRGRRIVHRLLERHGVWRLSFHTNALQMAFNEGTRNEGLALLAQLNEHCPEFYAQMLKEATDD